MSGLGAKFRGYDSFSEWKQWAEERGCHVVRVCGDQWISLDDEDEVRGNFDNSTNQIPSGRHDCLAIAN